MFCTKCGWELAEDDNFCPKCGKIIDKNLYKKLTPSAHPVKTLPNDQPRVITATRVLSIIGIIWFTLGIITYSSAAGSRNVTDYTIFSMTFCFVGFALAHGIVALVQGVKNKIKVLKTMGIFGIIFYAFSLIVILVFVYEDYKISFSWGVIASMYALAFSIAACVKSKIKTDK